MQNRRQVRVVEVEGVREGAVQEGGARRRIPAAPSYDARLLPAAPALDHPACHPGGLHPARSERDPDHVRDSPSCILKNIGVYVAAPYSGGKTGDALQQSLLHRCTSASGRTGEPVPPTILSGARTNRNSLTPPAARGERFMTSMMWTPYSTRSSRWTGSSACPTSGFICS